MFRLVRLIAPPPAPPKKKGGLNPKKSLKHFGVGNLGDLRVKDLTPTTGSMRFTTSNNSSTEPVFFRLDTARVEEEVATSRQPTKASLKKPKLKAALDL